MVDDGFGTAFKLSDDLASYELIDVETVEAQAVNASIPAPIARKASFVRIKSPSDRKEQAKALSRLARSFLRGWRMGGGLRAVARFSRR